MQIVSINLSSIGCRTNLFSGENKKKYFSIMLSAENFTQSAKC